MMDASLGTPYSRYAAFTSLMLKTFSQKCLDVSYSTYLKDMSNTSWSGPAAGGGEEDLDRGWSLGVVGTTFGLDLKITFL